MPYKDPEKRRENSKHNHKLYCQRHPERIRQIRERWIAKKTAWFDELKLSLRCVNCGVSDPYVLQFHHVDPSTKKFEISLFVKGGGKTYDQVSDELAKCEVLCANCHQLHHSHKSRPLTYKASYGITSGLV